MLVKEKEKNEYQRIGLFGNKNPDDEENRAVKAIEEAEQAKLALLEELKIAETNVATAKHQIEEWSMSIKQRQQKIAALEISFNSRLQQKDFADEQGYLSASLPEQEITLLKQKADQLQAEEYSLLGAKKEISKQLATETERRLTEDSLDNLKIVEQEWAAKKEILVQAIGANTQILKQNQKSLEEHRDKIRAKEIQEKQWIKWKNLDNLIGSADGKKYRNFAQGLTFEYMIKHANIQLQKMFDRYVLLRDRDKPLELCVIDHYQGEQVRSVKNLSGGESFVVSLALALGLSKMASKNVQIDSLFLDEGFGTLDEEALDMALTTLSGLRQEGKLIGVISHVQALKDRISTQIQLVPEGNGHSRIEGVGCRSSSQIRLS
ncbi:MAG: hypothetical protein LBU51_06955 [Bacteroidales bacterium]|jgi:exonuclease SbcC|nr:hypothetical protein [Bacteroidales bacterium]